ncbi:DUF6377 domain-containing protein [Sphingobacterium siyangense]|uniref:DUF6377 domain-containing protein n=1 Tax=Sphingobacterium siyangense TaxID=459529 RepID=UPI003C75F0AE
MKIVFILFALTIFLKIDQAHAAPDLSYESAFSDLKNVVAKRNEYFKKKLDNITLIRSELNKTKDPAKRFNISRILYEKYFDVKIDTSLSYARRMLAYSENELRAYPNYKVESLILIARAYNYVGMYRECEELLNGPYLKTGEIPKSLKLLYFNTRLEFSKGMAERLTIDGKATDIYNKAIAANTDSLIFYTSKNPIWYSIHKANRLRLNGDYDRALSILTVSYNKLTTEDRDMAHVAYLMARLESSKHNEENEKKYLAISAITDIKHGVKEYVSLWKLAILIYESGDIETAYSFIETSLQDSRYSGAYRRTQQIIKVLPEIYNAYNVKIIQQRNELIIAFCIILCLSLGVYFQYQKLQKAKKNLKQVNDDLIVSNIELNEVGRCLNLSNADLQLANVQLLYLNKELTSANIVKEMYLAKIIDLCSDYIDKLNDHRVYLKRLVKGGKVDKIKQELNSTEFIDQEYKVFLTKFDETFLKIYPNFIIDFNNLFPEADRQEVQKCEMTTEIRIYALIRLGIRDSNKISRFLRCSISTIYTYRSKIKNRSLCPELFENRVKEI